MTDQRAFEPTGRHAVREIATRPAPPPPEPADSYGRVLGLTVAWYGVPALLCVIWLIAMDSDRRASANRALLTNLPWFFTALVLSLAIAFLLRRAAIGWRTWTMCLAAAIIGAGVATVIHSFAL